ncbi:unnamed protein product, partial [Rotaria sp. Silwood1]
IRGISIDLIRFITQYVG